MIVDSGSASVRAIEASLAGGGVLSAAVLPTLQSGSAFFVRPSALSGVPLNEGRGLALSESDSALDRLLVENAQSGTLLVEDDLALPGDSCIGEALVYCGDVVHTRWASEANPAQFVRRNSSGYPTNAFVIEAAPDLGRSAFGARLRPDLLASRVSMIIVSIHDGEGFGCWMRSDSVAEVAHD